MANSALTPTATPPPAASISESQLAAGATLKQGGTTATTSGTSVDLTGIPAGTKQIILTAVGVSTNGTSNFQLQLGDAGGIETSGYTGSIGANDTSAIGPGTFSAGFLWNTNVAAATAYSAQFILSRHTTDGLTWNCFGMMGHPAGFIQFFQGTKTLTQELDRVRFTMANGTDAFDAGSVNIAYK